MSDKVSTPQSEASASDQSQARTSDRQATAADTQDQPPEPFAKEPSQTTPSDRQVTSEVTTTSGNTGGGADYGKSIMEGTIKEWKEKSQKETEDQLERNRGDKTGPKEVIDQLERKRL